jgi:hypothetical protein
MPDKSELDISTDLAITRGPIIYPFLPAYPTGRMALESPTNPPVVTFVKMHDDKSAFVTVDPVREIPDKSPFTRVPPLIFTVGPTIYPARTKYPDGIVAKLPFVIPPETTFVSVVPNRFVPERSVFVNVDPDIDDPDKSARVSNMPEKSNTPDNDRIITLGPIRYPSRK